MKVEYKKSYYCQIRECLEFRGSNEDLCNEHHKLYGLEKLTQRIKELENALREAREGFQELKDYTGNKVYLTDVEMEIISDTNLEKIDKILKGESDE